MIRVHYEKELQRVQDELILMGSMVTQALHDSVDILKRQDLEAAEKLVAADAEINRRRFKIEDDALTLIATQGPMARDMRFLAAVLDLSSELERIGDYAKGIGRITIYLGKDPVVKPLIHIPEMSVVVVEMLRLALDAFINLDVTAARQIPQKDDAVDELYNTVNRELLQLIIANPSIVDRANYYSWAAHNLERAADRVVNICERIVYTATGEFVELDQDESVIDFA
ncbi:MAG: phosphate signaling complex protein PhoU [Caldilineaceae bacterium]|nr:phosphate signaling complex protein PhoU [Caldilineaceae bacterium]